MTDNATAPAPPDEDRTPTQSDDAPPIKPADPWVMPEPVFRSSGGFTPRVATGNEDPTVTPDSMPTLEIDAPSVDENDPETEADTQMIAEQPEEISEPPAMTATPLPDKKKSGFFRFLLMILGISVIALIVGAALTAVVLWYFFQVSESQNLN
jgi:hypothetical protein